MTEPIDAGAARERSLRRAFERDPSNVVVARELARLLGRRRERRDEVVELWQRHVDAVAGSETVDARMSLARAQIEARRERDALSTLRRCVEEAPNHSPAFDLLGELLRQLGLLEEAVEALRTAGRLDPDAVRPRVALVTCLDALGRREEAQEVLEYLQRKGAEDPRLAALVRELMHRRG